jgi:PRC-barrel domain protein
MEEANDVQVDIWTYDTSLKDVTDLTGFDVEAADGSIGHVDEATFDVGASYLVVDTGPWIFGKKVLLPASAIKRVDLDNRSVSVRLTKEQIKSAPEFDENSYRNEDYRKRVGTYYAGIL